jgi:hypothetical protein
MFTAGLLAWKECPGRARRLADDPAVETATAQTGAHASARCARTHSSPDGRSRYVMDEGAQRMGCGAKRMADAVRDRLAYAGYPVILSAALLIAHDWPRL